MGKLILLKIETTSLMQALNRLCLELLIFRTLMSRIINIILNGCELSVLTISFYFPITAIAFHRAFRSPVSSYSKETIKVGNFFFDHNGLNKF